MNPRVEYEMSEADYKRLLEACRPVPVMKIGNYIPDQQENANNAWADLGRKMGFDSMSVRPSERGPRFFTAVPSETDAQRRDREERVAEEKRVAEIASLEAEIATKQARLAALSLSPGEETTNG